MNQLNDYYRFVIGAVLGPLVGIAVFAEGISRGTWWYALGGAVVTLVTSSWLVASIIGWVRGREGMERSKHWSGE